MIFACPTGHAIYFARRRDSDRHCTRGEHASSCQNNIFEFEICSFQCLDTGDEFPFSPGEAEPEVVLAFAETLRCLFDSLPEPVVPIHLHSKCVQMTSRDEAFEV